MPLTLSQDSGDWYVSGVGRGAARALLGRVRFTVDNHLVGFDDRFAEPVVMNAFWDPSTSPDKDRIATQGPFDYLGYLQFMQINFAGQPLPTNYYQGRLADRFPYVFGKDQQFLDFMGPASALVRGVVGGNPPMYAFNGMLKDPAIDSLDSLTIVPRPNGWLRPGVLTDAGPDGQALCAAIRAESAPGLLTAKDIKDWLDGKTQDEDPLTPDVIIPVSDRDLAMSEPYKIAMTAMRGTYLARIDDDRIYAQVIGPYVLLTLPQDEGFGPTLVITQGPGPAVLVYELSEYDMVDLTGSVVRDALQRFRNFALSTGRSDAFLAEPQDRYGFSPIEPLPMTLPAGAYVLELKYWTVGAGLRLSPGRLRYISGFTWSLLFQFDPVAETLEFTAIQQPARISGFDLVTAMTAYYEALTAYRRADIDTSNFTAAAIERENFASRGSLLVVNASREVITP